jgi:cytoskeletal protein RodZ
LPSFGEKLKLEREKRKITLDQISASTKISNRMLQALEEDKFNQLPGGIFNKGFVRAYSRAVGLDEDQTVSEYLQASGDAPLVRPELPRDPDPDSDDQIEDPDAGDSNSRPLPWGWLAAALLVPSPTRAGKAIFPVHFLLREPVEFDRRKSSFFIHGAELFFTEPRRTFE